MSNTDYVSLAEQILQELDADEPTPRHPEAVGNELPPEWYRKGLELMRKALVPPYTLSVIDPETFPGKASTKRVVIVADDRERALLAFDPHPEGNFVLVWRSPGRIVLSHVRGDAVGCFLAI